MITGSNLLSRIPPLFADLAKLLAGEIECAHGTLTHYSSDGSPYQIFPQAVIYPKNTTDIKHVLSFAREYTMPLSVRGNGSGRNGGCLSEGIVLDMTRYFNQIRNINMVENSITVDAGAKVGLLLEKLHSWNYDIPFFLGMDKEATVGAMFATKSASGSSFHHGTIREWVEGITVVVDNGEEHKIADGITPSGRLLGIYQEVFPLLTKEASIVRGAKPKSHDDATGYNIWNTSIGPRQLLDQLAGSEGTLGIITSITFRIAPYKQHILTTCIPVTKESELPSLIEIAKHHRCEHMFLYDEAFMQLAERYHPTLVPFFPETPYVLLATHTDTDKERLAHTVRTFRNALPVEGYTLKTIDDRKKLEHIVGNEFLFTLFSMYTNNTFIPIPSGNGLIVTIHQLPAFMEEVKEYLDSTGKLYTITGNIGSGHIAALTLFDPLSKQYNSEIVFYTKHLLSIIKKYSGGISTTGGDGLTRTPFLSYIYSDAVIALFGTLKKIWDPLLILNPGKKQGVTTTYLNQHLRKTGT